MHKHPRKTTKTLLFYFEAHIIVVGQWDVMAMDDQAEPIEEAITTKGRVNTDYTSTSLYSGQ